MLSQELRQLIYDYTLKNLTKQPTTYHWEKLLDLYKQSMIIANNDNFKRELYQQGLNALRAKDNLRTMDYKVVFKDLLHLIKL